MPRPSHLQDTVPWAIFAAAVLAACGGGDPGKSRSGDSSPTLDSAADTGEACEPVLAPPVDGCFTVVETDNNGDGRLPELVRTQYAADGQVSSTDFRSGDTVDTGTFCHTEWTGEQRTALVCAGSSSYRYDYAYEDGLLVEQTYDAARDGVLDKRWVYTYNGDGQPTEIAVDDDVDGTPDALQTLAYDGDHLVEETWDYTLNGTADYVRTLTWDGELLTQEVVDTNGDGTPDRTHTWTYNAWGQPLSLESDTTGDGAVDTTQHWTYAGCALDSSFETNLAGERERVTYTFDDQGRELFRIEDWGDDGELDRIYATTWQCPGL